MRAKLCRFYGWTHEYVTSLPFNVALDYWNAITPVEAREALTLIKISDYPHTSEKSRREFNRHLDRAGRIKGDDSDIVKSSHVLNILQGSMNG